MDGQQLEFGGTERYEVVGRLGAGAMGVVYLAHDRECDGLVALKMLRQLNANAIYRFKREFRSLVDVSHPHLVSLYELVAFEDTWFYTMEVVEGGRLSLLRSPWGGGEREDQSRGGRERKGQ